MDKKEERKEMMNNSLTTRRFPTEEEVDPIKLNQVTTAKVEFQALPVIEIGPSTAKKPRSMITTRNVEEFNSADRVRREKIARIMAKQKAAEIPEAQNEAKEGAKRGRPKKAG